MTIPRQRLQRTRERDLWKTTGPTATLRYALGCGEKKTTFTKDVKVPRVSALPVPNRLQRCSRLSNPKVRRNGYETRASAAATVNTPRPL